MITCYKEQILPVGAVDNSELKDEYFTGIVVDYGARQVKVHYPWAIEVHGSNIVIKDQKYGKSVLINPADTDYPTVAKLTQHLRWCMELDYYAVFYPAGDEITLSYDISGWGSYSVDSINASLFVTSGTQKFFFHDNNLVDGSGRPSQGEIGLTFATNKIKFSSSQQGRRVEVYIKKMWKNA